jgi:urease accessory protein
MMLLAQYSDSAFPVGSFTFSNGLESAAYHGIVHDASTLESFVRAVMTQSAFTDGVAALHAWDAVDAEDYDAMKRFDALLMTSKMSLEARVMSRRMGRRLSELAAVFYPADEMLGRWLTDMKNGVVEGSFPVSQGLLFHLSGLGKRPLFAANQYGVVNMLLNAALRCVKVSHFDTQRILMGLCSESAELYEEVRDTPLEEMHSFAPQVDLCASLHEKGTVRMFMS